MKIEEIFEANGIDPVKLATKLNLMYLLTDIADGYATEVEHILKKTGHYRNADKQNLKAIKRHTSLLVHGVSKTLGLDSPLCEGFGELSDFLKEIIETTCTVKGNHREKVREYVSETVQRVCG